ncbi:MAG: CDP-alcohol phosphatidyltransferase family protein [Candidatus Kerfeldbacteria bacterium]
MDNRAQTPINPRSVIKKEDGVLAYYFSAQVANLIVRATRRLPLKPNHFTAASLVLGLGAAYLFSVGTYEYLVAGIITLHVSFIFDCCDGQLSRLKGLQSKMGHWFDYHSDKLKDAAVLFGFAYGAFIVSDKQIWWIFIAAFAAITFQFMRNITALNRDNFKLEQEGQKDAAHSPIASDSGSQLMRTLKHSVLFKLSDRVLLFTVFGLLNLAHVGVIVYAVLETFYALSSAVLAYRMFHRYDKKQVNQNHAD